MIIPYVRIKNFNGIDSIFQKNVKFSEDGETVIEGQDVVADPW